jgi:nucleoid DNA-binding protein
MRITERKFEELVAAETGQTVETVEFYTEAVEKVLKTMFEQGFTVSLRGLGTFRMTRIPGREYKMPDGTLVYTENKRTIRFRVAKKVEQELNSEKTPEDFREIKELTDIVL